MQHSLRFRAFILLLFFITLMSAFALAGCNPTGEIEPEEPSETPDTYTVTFESNGGTELEALTYTKGDAALSLPEPFRYQYVFSGWYIVDSFEGESVDATDYTPEADTVLYAKWTPCVYLYLYYGIDGFESERITYFAGDSIAVSDLFIPEDITVDGAACPFLKWTYEDGTEISEDEIVFSSENVLLLANYDKSAVPLKKYLEENDDGSYTTTGRVAWIFTDEGKQIGVYSATVTFDKGSSGAAGIAFRMSPLPGDYAFEAGCNYLSAQFHPSTGGLQVSSVTNGIWAHMTGSVVALSKLPAAYQEKYNAATTITAEIAVADYGDRFEVYIDGELAYTSYEADAELIAGFTGTGFGVRCSTTGAIFSDFMYQDRGPVTVSFESNGGSACESVTWIYGVLRLPVSVKSGSALKGWYYDDSTFENKVEENSFTATSDITLFANWTEVFYVISFNSNGGTECENIAYAGGGFGKSSRSRTRELCLCGLVLRCGA